MIRKRLDTFIRTKTYGTINKRRWCIAWLCIYCECCNQNYCEFTYVKVQTESCWICIHNIVDVYIVFRHEDFVLIFEIQKVSFIPSYARLSDSNKRRDREKTTDFQLDGCLYRYHLIYVKESFTSRMNSQIGWHLVSLSTPLGCVCAAVTTNFFLLGFLFHTLGMTQN